MDCTTATELLPWLINGSLENGERRSLVEHLAGCGACRAELAETAEAWKLMSAHPPAALLAAWAEGEDVPDAETLARHVAACPNCEEEVALVREAATLEAVARISHQLPAAAADARHPVVLSHLRVLDGQSSTPTRPSNRKPNRAQHLGDLATKPGEICRPAPVPGRPVGGGATQWRRIAIAAVLVAGVSLTALLGSWLTAGARNRLVVNEHERGRIAAAEARIETLSAELEALTERARGFAAPLANLAVIELLPDSFTLRGGSGPASVALGADAVALILATAAGTGLDGYRLRVIDDGGAEIWRADDLVRQPTDDFTVLLPLGALKPGDLRLVIDGRRGADWSELETYRLVISG